jgi:zinc protease
MTRCWTVWPALIALFTLPCAASADDKAKGYVKVASVEGITEYRLDNGVRVLLYPDPSSSKVTVNMTVLVGSRHEGYGETGMAHLLEHMVFKGTPDHPTIPKALADRGAQYNGTTNVDRTNYFETLNASDDNLEFAIRLEADRLVNSLIKREDLASEFSVVRSEFEMGENSPPNILNQRMLAAAYEWHNYGKSTIGNRTDIERVPVDRLRVFYRKFYQPDNVVVIVAGNFDEAKALALLVKYFGKLKKPERTLETTYTEEPPQDGERSVTLRRAGGVGAAGALYHVPAASHADFPALEVLAAILSDPASGRLHTGLVKSGKATAAFGFVTPAHDPGWFEVLATSDAGKSPEDLRDAIIALLEKLPDDKFDEAEVERAKTTLARRRTMLLKDANRMASVLSEWAARGDWRLLFLNRDAVDKVTAADVSRVAKKYLLSSNRTSGVFIPTDKPVRSQVPPTPEILALVKDYKGGQAIAAGERLDTDPLALEKRVQRSKLAEGGEAALLPFKARENAVAVNLTLRFGNEESLKGNVDAADFLATLMMRGTKKQNRQQIEDALAKLKATVRESSSPGQVSFIIDCNRESLPAVLALLREVLREPTFPDEEFTLLKRQTRDSIERARTDPASLAQTALERKLSPYPKDHPLYTTTSEEDLQRLEALTLDRIRKLYAEQLTAANAELVVVGDFEPGPTLKAIEEAMAGWKSEVKYKRIERKAGDPKAETVRILTPDKANAVYRAGLSLAMNDEDPDYAALVLGDYILGGGSLSSRLGNRVRQQAGLSYTVASRFSADHREKAGRLILFAISNPANADKAAELIAEELNKLVKDGPTTEEVTAAKKGYLESRKGRRSGVTELATLLETNLAAGRTLEHVAEHEKKIAATTPEDVAAALKKRIDPKKLVVVQAGDFKK